MLRRARVVRQLVLAILVLVGFSLPDGARVERVTAFSYDVPLALAPSPALDRSGAARERALRDLATHWGDRARAYDDRSVPARASASLGRYRLAPPAIGALDDASRIAFRAANTVDDFTVPLKHQPWASGNYAKFAAGVHQRALISDALRSEGSMFLPNNRAGPFRVWYDFGRPIGTVVRQGFE